MVAVLALDSRLRTLGFWHSAEAGRRLLAGVMASAQRQNADTSCHNLPKPATSGQNWTEVGAKTSGNPGSEGEFCRFAGDFSVRKVKSGTKSEADMQRHQHDISTACGTFSAEGKEPGLLGSAGLLRTGRDCQVSSLDFQTPRSPGLGKTIASGPRLDSRHGTTSPQALRERHVA
jgi:hypothetical protein